MGKNLAANAGDAGVGLQFLDREDPLEEEMATRSSTPVWGIPWTRGAWRTVVHGVTQSQMTESRSVHAPLYHPVSLSQLITTRLFYISESASFFCIVHICCIFQIPHISDSI